MSTQFDQTRAETFAEYMMNVLNHAGVALSASIGHRTGLFDTLARHGPAACDELAAEAGLNERYVREWLGVMVTADVVDFDAGSGKYSLPAEHATSLTRDAGPTNMAGPAQFIPLLAQVEDRIVDCFQHGGGVPYSAYPRFHELMAEDSRATHDLALIDEILPLVPGLPARLNAGIDVADIGCGTGHALNLMARAFPQSRFTGYDIAEQAIEVARCEARRLGLDNASFEVCDAAALDMQDRFDLITAFDAIHDQAAPATVLEGIANALRPEGVFLMVDFGASSHVHENRDFPLASFLYTISMMHCVPVSMNLDGPGLGAMWGEACARRMLARAGFEHVDVKPIEQDPLNACFIASRG